MADGADIALVPGRTVDSHLIADGTAVVLGLSIDRVGEHEPLPVPGVLGLFVGFFKCLAAGLSEVLEVFVVHDGGGNEEVGRDVAFSHGGIAE